MEDSWKTKCSSPWTSVPSSSSQHLQQGARNQEVRPLDSYVAQNSMVFNSSNLGSCRTAKPDLGNSFLSLLSRPSPQLQQKVQPVPCSSSMDSGKLPVQNSNGAFSGDSHGVPLTPIGLIYPHLGNYNMTTGPEQVLVSSAAASTSTYSRFPDMHSIYQMANITCNKETNQRGLHPIGHGNMIGTNSTHPPQGWLSINRADRQHNTTKVQAFQVPSVIGSATSGPVVAYANGCLRVFCLATNGELLLGSKGLLGVVCLCHGMQMSVSKFCEHSGSCIVNPGDAVRLESGETVSQWRRLFFPKYGMKVPDDNSGWDWPEKNPAIVEMENCKVNVPGISKNSQMTKACDPFMGLAKSGQHWNEFISVDNTNNTFSDVIHSSRQTKTQEGCNLPTKSGQNWSNFVSTNNSRTGESVTGNTFGGVMHNVRLGNAQEGWIPPRSTVLTAQGIIMPAPADIQTTHMVKRGSRSSGSEKVREDSGYQSISEYIDFLTKGGDSLLVNQSLGNFKYLGTVSDARRVTDSTVASIIQNDGTTSNFELRLGQPSQQSYDLDGSVISDVQPQPSVAYSDNQMSLSLDPRSHNVFIPRLTEESRQHLQCSSSDALDCQRWNERNLNFRQFAPGDPAKGEPPKGLAKSPQIIFPKHNTLSERDVMAWANNNNYMGTFTSAELLGTSAPLEFPRNRTDGAQVQQNSNFLCPLNGMDRIKGTQHSADNGSYATTKGNSSFHNCHMSNVSSFLGVTSNNHLSSGKAVNGKQSSFWCQSPGVVNDPSNIRNQSHPHGKASFHQGSNCHDGHPLGAINYSTLTSPGLSWPEVSADYPLTSSNCRQNLMRMWSNYESIHPSPHFLDENLRLLEPMQATDPCKQNHVTFPYEVQRQRERMYSRSSVEMQQRLSTSTLGASEEHKEGPYLTSKTDSHECSVKPLQTCCSQYVDGGFEKLAGVKSQCNYSTSSQGIIFLSEEPDIVHPPHHDPLGGEVALASVGRTVNNTVTSVEHGICSKKEPSSFINWNCNCAVHTNCFVENSVSRVDALDGSSKAQKENIIVNTSKPVNNHKLQEEKKRNQTENFDMNRVRKDYHASMWRDVPRKCTKVGNATNPKKPTAIVNASNESQLVETVSKKFDGAQVAESLNEHQMSNMYSGCSAPAVTDVTFEVNNTNSCTVDAEDYGLVNEHVVDEGSGIERCWSSDDALDSGKSTETVNISHKLSSAKGGKFALLHGCADTGRIESSFASKKLRKGLRADFSVRESISGTETHINNFKTAKRKKTVKWKRLDTSGLSSVQCDSFQSVGDTDSHSSSSRGTETLNKHYQGWMRTCGVKRKRSTLLAVSSLYQKKDLCKFAEDDKEWEGNGRKELKDDITHLKISALSSQEKPKLRRDPDLSRQFPNQEINQRDTRKAAKSNSDSCAKNFSSNQVDTFDKRTTPVVCGKYGIISNGKLGEDGKITAKVVSLSTILKTARICSTTRTEEPKLTSTAVKKKKCFKRKTKCYSKASVFEDGGRDSENSSIFETKKASFSEDAICLAALSMPAKEENGNSDTVFKQDILYSGAPLKSRFKEARKRSLSELAGKGDDLLSSSCLPNNDPEGTLRSTFKSHIESLKKVVASKCHGAELSQNPTKKCMKAQKGDAFILDSDASCSVCGSSTRDADNCLLECSSCLIKVHQACYGVSRVPKGHWSCRPCRANSKDNVCVLCGYDGGALTQALKSRNIVKSLLEAWSIASEPMSRDFSPLFETSKDKLKLLHISGSGYKVEAKSGTDQSVSAVLISDSVDGMDVIQTSNVIPSELQVHNSITAGVVDPTIKQWVHMVCGLWTAGTRCPNVDTMSAFDVSGVSLPPDNVVCSMCNRPGGSCIKCRIVQCSVHFHPWCAHQKGLLQSEVEGIDNDMVGFYGRCVLHAKRQCSDSVLNVIGNELDSLGREEFTCARTEGCKGRRKDGFRHKLHKGSDECLVPQEQIDAWLHINTQKPCARGISKLQTSDIEHDCRKEYARYKQVKGWKNLVVYKSGIHGLGLYTSQFISRGAMVVEYVGEIVGLRVADKRELEYHSGKKLQYKAACYFFRIDKEHIIDATRKGGIARFVNHSCLPNCVAKIISVRNDKKVVFFAERDIYPGEEVTYDYHFNHEDEGEKIPCFCSSKNCRQYLN